MITVKQKYSFPGATGATEVYYTMSSSNTCVSVTPVSSTVTPGTTVEFTFTFATEACFNTVFTLQTWDDVCATPVSTSFSIASPCSTLTGTISNTPSTTNPFIFTVAPSGGTAGYSIEWQYNTGLFSLISDTITGTVLELSPVSIVTTSGTILPGTAEIKAKITDSNGCTETISYIYTLCTPQISNYFLPTHCVSAIEIGSITARNRASVTIEPVVCAGTTIDWSSTQLSYDTTKLYANVGRTTSTIATIEVYGIRPTTASQYNITYSVADNFGVRSATGTITVSLNVCPLSGAGTISGPVIGSTTTTLLTGEGSGTIKTLNVEDITFSAE